MHKPIQIIKTRAYGIGMTLSKDDKNSVYGALRNIQLTNLFLPKWKVYIYIPTNVPNTRALVIEDRIKQKMIKLGATIVYIDLKKVMIPVTLINTLIADNKHITHFLIRDVRHRLSDCDARVAHNFLASDKSIHYFKYQEDKPQIKNKVVPGIWEGNRKKLTLHLQGKTMQQYIQVVVLDIHFISL